MYETALTRQLQALRAWRQSQLRLLEQLQPWLRQQGLVTDESRQAIERAVHALHDDHLTVAVAGEFSRGKTELLNALFFADLGCRLLPTDAGRTTMCPTEIYHDESEPPQLRLLPIETRRERHSLEKLRQDSTRWTVLPLQLDNPDSLSQTLQQLTERANVDRSHAASLGLSAGMGEESGREVSIPRWRLAQVNIPHPLLSKGLRLLDTPGLNAIGGEPELTYEMLPAAHAILFVLGADTGVTASDMEIWRRYIQRPGQRRNTGLMVVVNKTDTLWDELRSPGQVAQSIVSQCRDVAETLDVNRGQVFAVSAQKALLARIQGNTALERRSGISSLERHLGGAIIDQRIDLIQREHTRLVLRALDTLETIIASRVERNENQQRNLLDLADRSNAAINRMLIVTQGDLNLYQANVDAFKRSLLGFRRHAQRLLGALNVGTLEHTLTDIHNTMTGAWTTMGLRHAMRRLFDEVNDRLETAGTQTQLMRRRLRTTHRHFEKEHDFKLEQPSMLSLVRYQVELSLLEQEADIFRNSPRTTLMEQHFVTRRYFGTIVARVRAIIGLAHEEAGQWVSSVMVPLTAEVTAHRDNLARQIADLKAAAGSRNTVQLRIVSLRRDNGRLRAQMQTLNKVRSRLANRESEPSARVSGQN